MIMSPLSPHDIVSLRRTCRLLSSLTQTRLVWHQALTQVCLCYGIAVATFDRMNMTQKELELAATMPARFLSSATRASKSDTGDLDALRQRRIRCVAAMSPNMLGNDGHSLSLDNVAMLPGGRYVLAQIANGLGLWDLGSETDESCLLLTGPHPTPGIKAHWNMTHFDKDTYNALFHLPGTSKVNFYATVFVGDLRNFRNEQHCCVVYQLDLSVTPPTCSLLGFLPDAIPYKFADSESLIFQYTKRPRDRDEAYKKSLNICGIWNFVQSTATSWYDETKVNFDFVAITVANNCIVHKAGKRFVAVYEMPELLFCDNKVPPPTSLRELQHIELADAGETRAPVNADTRAAIDLALRDACPAYASDLTFHARDSVWSRISDASTTKGFLYFNKLLFEALSNDRCSPVVHSRSLLAGNAYPPFEFMLGKALTHVRPGDAGQMNAPAFVLRCDRDQYKLPPLPTNDFLLHWVFPRDASLKGRVVHLKPLKEQWPIQGLPSTIMGPSYDFCPASGRLCYVEHGRQTLIVIDFVEGPVGSS